MASIANEPSDAEAALELGEVGMDARAPVGNHGNKALRGNAAAIWL